MRASLLLLATLLSATLLHGGEPGPSPKGVTPAVPSGTDESLLRGYLAPEVAFRYDYDFPMDLDDGSGGYAMHEFRLSVPLPPVVSDTFVFFANLNYRLFAADVDTPVLNEDLDLHTLRLPMQAAWLSPSSPWMAIVYVEPGLSTDFSRVDSDSFDLSAGVGIGYRFSPTFMAALGVGYSRNYGDDEIFPVLALLWKPAERFTLAISPDGILPAYKVNDGFFIKLKLEVLGGRWTVEDEAGRERLLRLEGGTASLLLEHRLFEKCWMTLGVGINAFSELRVEDGSGRELLDEDLKEGIVVRSGIKWVF